MNNYEIIILEPKQYIISVASKQEAELAAKSFLNKTPIAASRMLGDSGGVRPLLLGIQKLPAPGDERPDPEPDGLTVA